VVGTLSFSLMAYLAGNRQCETDQFGRGCGRIRWAAVQIKRKSIAMCAHLLDQSPNVVHSSDAGPEPQNLVLSAS
jgi:hypothetical protein